MALTEVYVDPSIAADSGTGTIGDPFGDLEYAIEQSTLGTDGTRFNIKAGTDEILAAELDTALSDTGTTPAFAPDGDQPVVFQGYTATAGDGGLCGISGGGLVEIISTSKNGIWFVDCHLHSCPAGTVASAGSWMNVVRCKIEGEIANAGSLIVGSTYSRCLYNYFIVTGGDSGDYALIMGTVARIRGNYFDLTGGNTLATAINCSGGNAEFNTILAGTGYGINLINASSAINNSIYANGSTRVGISHSGVNPCIIMNNLIEGFSGVGGIGINAHEPRPLAGGNAVYNCTTAYNISNSDALDLGDNETLSASPFTDAANGNLAPVDTGNVFEGSLPNVIGGGLV